MQSFIGTDQQQPIDEEWVQLMWLAKHLGYTSDEIRTFIEVSMGEKCEEAR